MYPLTRVNHVICRNINGTGNDHVKGIRESELSVPSMHHRSYL
jgi:hypothetical protein